MKAVFVESKEFTAWVGEYLPDETYAALQEELMDDPRKGMPIRGCGGLRKIRISDPGRGKGKRGGARIIYLHVPEAKRFYMLDIYGKDEKDDLSSDEKKTLRALAQELKKEAKAAFERSQGKDES
ncbi:MAG: type II toxin-antitoxin system RelE/ParE family toxin [Planctomycetaceae bacterium]